jgi:hypothetical protein
LARADDGAGGAAGRSYNVSTLRLVVRDSIVDTANVMIGGSASFIEDIFCFADIGTIS